MILSVELIKLTCCARFACSGLTVPFALTAGLSSLGSSRLVTVAGVAELVSGAISMGVGGYLSAQAERDHFRYQLKSTRVSIQTTRTRPPLHSILADTLSLNLQERVQRSCAGEMEREVSAILSPLGIEDSLSRRVAGSLLQVEASLPAPAPHPSIVQQVLKAVGRRPRFSLGNGPDERASLLTKEEPDDDKGLTAFLLKFGEGMEEVGDGRLVISAFTIGLAYFLGGLVPLLPYFFIPVAGDALWVSVAITALVLLLFGGFKQYFTGATIGWHGYAYGCISTLAVGGSAAAASFAIVKALEGGGL